MLKKLRQYWPFLILALIPLFPLWRAVFLGQTIGPWDQIRHFAPWNESAPDRGWDVLQADSAIQFYVWRDLVFHAWGSGHVPVWNPYELGGTPLLANSQSGALYPFHILFGILHVPTSLAITLLAWFHLALAGIGTFLLVRRLGGTEIGAFLAGGGFALSGFMVAWTSLASVTTTVSWLPWCIWASYGLFDSSPAVRQPARVWLALAVAMMLLGGHLQFAAYGMLAIGIVIATLGVQSRKFLSVATALGCLFCGLLMASPQLLPVLQNGQHSHRRNTPTWEGFESYNSGAIKPFELLSLPDPTYLGLPSETVHISDQPFTGYWPAFVQRGASYAETAIGIGPLLLAALILGWNLIGFKRAAGIAIFGLTGFLLAMGTIVGALLFFGFPGWSATASPGRASVLFVFAAAVLAGSMFNQNADVEASRTTTRRLLIFGAILLGAAAGVSQFPLQSWLQQLPAEALAATRLSALALLLRVGLGMGTGVLVYLALKLKSDEASETSNRQIFSSIGALVLFAVPSLFLIPTGDSRLPDIKSNAGRVAIVNNSWDLLTLPNATIPPNLSALFGVHELGGYDSLLDKAVHDRLEAIDGQDPAPLSNGNIMFVKDSADLMHLAEAGVSEIWSRKQLSQFPQVNPGTDGLYRYPVGGPGRVSVDDRPVVIASESADGLTIEAEGAGVLILRDNLPPAATASLDSHPEGWKVVEGNPWHELEVPSGKHRVELDYGGRKILLEFVGIFIFLSLIELIVRRLESRKIGIDESNGS